MAKIEINWQKLLLEVAKAILYALLGAGGASVMM